MGGANNNKKKRVGNANVPTLLPKKHMEKLSIHGHGGRGGVQARNRDPSGVVKYRKSSSSMGQLESSNVFKSTGYLGKSRASNQGHPLIAGNVICDSGILFSSCDVIAKPRKKIAPRRIHGILFSSCAPVLSRSPRKVRRGKQKNHQDDALLDMHITRIDLALDTLRSYRFEYRSFDILLEVTEAGNAHSGVLMSTAILHKLKENENGDTTICESLELNHKLNEKTRGAACLGTTRDDDIVLYYHSLAPIIPPDYTEFRKSVLEFFDMALEMRHELSPPPANRILQY